MNSLRDWLSLTFYAFGAVTCVLACVRYMFEWFSDYQDTLAMARETAYTHLPFIYKALKALCEKAGVELDELPQISVPPRKSPLLQRWMKHGQAIDPS